MTPEMQAHLDELNAWRALSREEQAEILAKRSGVERAKPSALDLQIAMMADLCPCGSGPCGCGAGPPRSCGDPERPGFVMRRGCIECQAVRWWQEGVEAW
jgi:hypothetical protein